MAVLGRALQLCGICAAAVIALGVIWTLVDMGRDAVRTSRRRP